jgi:hypothetical protein
MDGRGIGRWRPMMLAAGLAALVAAAVFLLGINYLRSGGAFNSDDLYCTDFCDDLLHGRPLTAWFLPGAPYLFPDMVLLLPLHGLAPNLTVEFLAYCLVFHLLLLAVVAWIAREVGLSRTEALLCGTIGVLFLAVAHLAPAYGGRAMLLVYPGTHLGAILTGLFLLGLTLRWLRHKPGPASAALYVLVGGLGIISDRLLLVQLLAPAGAALAILAACRKLPGRQFLLHASLMGGAVLVAQVCQAGLTRMGFQLLPLGGEVVFPRWPEFVYFFAMIGRDLADQALLQVLLPCYLVVAALVVACHWRRPALAAEDVEKTRGGNAPLVLALTALAAPVCNLLAMCLKGQVYNPAVNRYTLVCWLLPFLLLGLLLALVPGRLARAASRLSGLAVVLFALVRVAALLPQVDAAALRPPYPAMAQVLDRLVHERGPLRGLGGFDSARYLRFLTHEHVAIVPLDESAAPFFHAGNPDRYLDETRPGCVPEYQFILATPGHGHLTPSPAILEASFGPPSERISAGGGDEIWLYPRLASPAFDRFLRARLAGHLRTQVPVTAPIEPITLARPRPNLAPVTDARLLALAAGDGVEVRFAGPVAGKWLDVAAAAEDHCVLEFRRGAEALGRTEMPAVEWSGNSYGPPGIQARLLPVPPEAVGKGWDRVVVHPAGPNSVHMAHLLALDADLPQPVTSYPPVQRLRFEGESGWGLDLPGDMIRITEDAHASGGRARTVAAGVDGPFFWSPPVRLPPGHYTLECVARASGAAAGDEVAVLGAWCDAGGKPLATRTLRGSDLAGAGFTRQSLSVDLAQPTVVRLGVVVRGTAEVTLDYLELTASPSEPPAVRFGT